MEYFEQKPSALLAPYVKLYWMINSTIRTGQSHTQRIVPTGLIEFSFFIADDVKSSDSKKETLLCTQFTGQVNEHYDLIIKGKVSVFGIYLYPHAFWMLFNIPASEINNRTVSMHDLLNGRFNQVEEKLHTAGTFTERVQIMDDYLSKLVLKRTNNYNDSRITASINLISASKGLYDVNHLASEVCLGRKQFERIFKDYTGTSPKKLSKTIRFQHAVHQKSKNPTKPLTELAHNCGYFDQAHMTNDFLSISGMTPKQYFANDNYVSDYFA